FELCELCCSIRLPAASRGACRLALQEPADELLEAIERMEIPLVQQRLVRVVGIDDELVVHVVRPQELYETGSLRELDVAIVIPVDQQDRRLPRVNRGNRRRSV